ncbi:MAG: glycoside hydrolase family 2 TIM barrel-domain containing protein [Bacteroidales bacterium]|nr:glycoside hydrolase family 2 TIM barrel-domain containing protein [Bacteroidales bacterium]
MTSFDEGWLFLKDTISGVESPGFDDSRWRHVSVPHDWSVEDLPGQNGVDIIGPFDKSAIDKGSSGYMTGGIGWYRKHFIINEEDKDKIAYLQFDGVYMGSDVWLNGRHLGFHPYGYTPFFYDITSYLNPPGQSNVVAVRVLNEGMNSRWYSGSGINRHVWLILTNPVHIDVSGGLYITTPNITENTAEVRVAASLVNSGNKYEKIVLRTELTDPAGKVVASVTGNSAVSSGQTIQVTQEIPVNKPSLWSPDEPDLYTAKASVLINDEVVDEFSTHFGIRSSRIDAKNGFTLNGKPVELIGACIHHDNGPLGAASIDRAEERKIEVLKSNGFNAIRTAHNPPSPALLDACDRLGMLVINEIFDTWETAKRNQDYHLYFREWWQKDVESWVKRDRNHPSVIIWSIGNEIREAYDTSGLRIARNLAGEIRSLDTTRWVTECFNDFAWMRGQKSKWHEIPEHMALFDLIGYNYAYRRYEEDHIKYPDRVMIGTETNPPLALENYEMVKKHPYVIGYFVWTGTDNLGEAGRGMPQLRDIVPDPGNSQSAGGGFSRESWPVFTNYQGDIDLIGNKKVPSYYQHVVWGKSKVEMFVHRPVPEGKIEITSSWGFPDELKSWNWPGREGEKLQVHVYTRSQMVRLELNGRIVGEQTIDTAASITAAFEVSYEPGTLIARCYDNGRETASQTLKTTGRPKAVRLIADRTRIRADRNDLSYVRAEIIDSEGNIVPDADDILVTFEVKGSGEIAGVGSGNPADMSSFQQPMKKTWQGICLAIVRPEATPGKIRIRARAEGLKGTSLKISVE